MCRTSVDHKFSVGPGTCSTNSPSRSRTRSSIRSGQQWNGCLWSSARPSKESSTGRCRKRNAASLMGSGARRSTTGSVGPSRPSVKTCKVRSQGVKCRQPSWRDGLCSAHWNWKELGTKPDPSYERKVMTRLITPTWDWMTDSESRAVLNGRYRGDGRRIDQWVLHEPVMWEPS